MSQTAFTRLELEIPPPLIVGFGFLLNWFATRWAMIYSPASPFISALIIVSVPVWRGLGCICVRRLFIPGVPMRLLLW